jgi:LmbE family N-acetylglucosaminyl deacetylase
MAKIRVAEARKAAKIIKLTGIEFLNYPDGGLEQTDFVELVNKLSKKIEYYKPRVILTFGYEGISGHKDHIRISKATLAAVKKSQYKPDEILLASIPASYIKTFNEHLITRKVHHSHFKHVPLKGVPDKKLLKIDIRKYAQQKHRALKAHTSQYLPSFVPDGLQKHECFEILKP